MQGDPTKPINTTLTDLDPNDVAVPSLWDKRFKTLIDNDANLDRRVADVESGTRSVRSLQTVETLDALRTFSGAKSGEIVYIPGVGIYRYYAAATEAEALPWTLRPDSNSGRWRIDMVPRSVLGAVLGVATLDAQGFLAQSLPNGAVTAAKLGLGAVTSAALGNFTLSDSVTLNTNTATLEQLLGALGNRLRFITGGTTWRDTPGVDLKTLNQYAARLDRLQTWTQRQTFGAVTVTGELVIPVY